MFMHHRHSALAGVNLQVPLTGAGVIFCSESSDQKGKINGSGNARQIKHDLYGKWEHLYGVRCQGGRYGVCILDNKFVVSIRNSCLNGWDRHAVICAVGDSCVRIRSSLLNQSLSTPAAMRKRQQIYVGYGAHVSFSQCQGARILTIMNGTWSKYGID